MHAYEFDPNDVSITLSTKSYGTFAITCTGEDDVECSKDEDGAEAVVGAQGDVVVNRSRNQLGTIKFSVQAQSPQLPPLKRLADSTELFGIWVVNKSTNEKVGGTQAFLKKSADNKVGKKLGDRSFEVQVLDYTDR
nr:MAG TPA: Protein of unknown function (DUF3277) [Caudoviricetes sp.]